MNARVSMIFALLAVVILVPTSGSAFQVGVNGSAGYGFGTTDANPSRDGAAFGLQFQLRSPAEGFGGWRVLAGYDTQVIGLVVRDGARAINAPYMGFGLEYAFDASLVAHTSMGVGMLLNLVQSTVDDPAGVVFRSTVGLEWFTDRFGMALGYAGKVSYGIQLWGFTGSGHAVAMMGTATFYVVD